MIIGNANVNNIMCVLMFVNLTLIAIFKPNYDISNSNIYLQFEQFALVKTTKTVKPLHYNQSV